MNLFINYEKNLTGHNRMSSSYQYLPPDSLDIEDKGNMTPGSWLLQNEDGM